MSGCKCCGSQLALEHSSDRGELVCTACGVVAVENTIVSEMAFDKDSGGARMLGHLLASDGLTSFEKRKLNKSTQGQARKRLFCLGSQLRLSNTQIETGFYFYKLAFSQGLLCGQRNKVSDAVLLYITCRLESTPHMLMDFADILRVNLFKLGRLYLKLCRGLHLILPMVDPWQYVLRFASKLSLGEKRHEVATTALRLVARMNRDWMTVGRHPCGLYGAALLVAARLSSFLVSLRELSRVVGVHQSTIKKRLCEFKDTASGALTIDDFFSMDLRREEEPPSFKRGLAASGVGKRASSDSEEEETVSSLTRRTPTVNETIAKARYLQRLKNARPPSSEPTSQCELESLACYGEAAPGGDKREIGAADELDVSGLDEKEIEQYILSREEVAKKTQVWVSEFGQYEEEYLARQKRKPIVSESGENGAVPKKRRGMQLDVTPDSSTREVLQQVIHKTGLQGQVDIASMIGDGDRLTESVKEIETAVNKGYESGESDSHESGGGQIESIFREEVLAEGELFFEDYDIR